MRLLARLTMLAGVFGALVPRAVLGHPFHVGIAEMEYNTESDVIEVALRVFPDDLELALRRRAGEDLVLERVEDIDQLITDYLRETIILHRGDGSIAPLDWIGKEINVKEAWLYVELRQPGELNEASLTNTILFEVRPSQTNTVLFVIGSETRTYTFTIDEPKQRFVDAGNTTPLVLDVQRRHAALEAIVQNAAHLSRSERAAFELLGACASELLLHPSKPDSQQENQRLLDAALDMVSKAPRGEIGSADRARLCVMSAGAGHVRSAFNLLAEAVAASAGLDDAGSVLPEALRAAATLAQRHTDVELAAAWRQASEAELDDILMALGEARAYVLNHDHDEHSDE